MKKAKAARSTDISGIEERKKNMREGFAAMDAEEAAQEEAQRAEDPAAAAESRAAAPEAAAVWVPIDAVHPWENNPRKNDEASKEVAKSIKRFGFGSPIVARKADGEIIAGHTRYKAAQKLGLRKIPVRFVDLDPAEAHLLALADNRLGEEAEWDKDLLAAVTFDLQSKEVDLLEGTGFSETEIEKLLHPDDEPDLGGEGAEDESGKLGVRFQVIVDCLDERQQAMLIEKLEREGFKKVKATIG